jgi:hypothetical protein
MSNRDQPDRKPIAADADGGDPDAPPSDAERAEAESLRDALDRGGDHPGAEVARVLSAAWSPRDIAPAEHGAIVERVLARRASRGRVIRVSFGVSAVVALAASVLLFVYASKQPPGRQALPASVAVSRSTQPLFPERFATLGGESARIDRIAMARSADLRDNEFAKWGVR